MAHNPNPQARLLAAAAACAFLVGCSEFGDGGFGPHTAVEDPHSRSSGNDEIFTANTEVTPLLTIDFPNRKDGNPNVHTVIDDLKAANATAPATQAATNPADSAPATGDEIKITAQQKPADKIVITRDNEGNADLWITCETGIGSVTLQRTGESWPSILRLHLLYDKDKPFTRLEGLTANELSGDRQVPLKTTPDKDTGKGQINIPAFSRAPQIQIQWVDAHR